MIDVKEPKKIYENLDNSIKEIIDKLKIKTDDEKFEVSKDEIRNLINTFRKEKLNKAIDDLKKSQEWGKFTVAFYGETNAGKSTIIEALRIHFKEEEKLNQQDKFKIIFEEYSEKIRILKSQLETITEKFSEEDNQNKQLEKIPEEIPIKNLKKKEKSFFYKILSMVYSNDSISKVLTSKEDKYKEELRLIDDILKNKIDDIEKLKTGIKNFESVALEFLEELTDGQIIGDGRSDFTKKSTTYNFTYNNQEFAFLDMPGIEGHETIVIDEISHAVKKAHAVFYVTSSSTPPQKGDEHKKGTLEKIKEHLGSQTEVYTIFNKRVTNPMQLNKALVSDDEKDSLKIVDEKINDILKENYAGHKIVSAKIAFLAVAECLLVESQTYSEKKKFINKFSTNELMEKANFYNLCNFITDELVINTKQKIKKSNYNKASGLLNELIEILDKALKNNFEPLYKQVVQEVDDASNNLKNILRKTKIDLDSVVAKALRDFENNTRKDIYTYIDKNVSDDSFRDKFEAYVEVRLNILLSEVTLKNKYENFIHLLTKQQISARKDFFNNNYLTEDELKNIYQNAPHIPEEIKIQISIFKKSIREILKNFKRRVNIAIKDYQTLDFGNLDSKSAIDLKIDNGINGWGIAGSFLTVGGTVYTYWAIAAANSWNWVGWTMIAAGALTALLSFGKSIYKFLSDDYKKSEQKKAFEENMENILNDIEPKILGNLELIKNEIIVLIDNVINDLENIVTQREMTNTYITNAHYDLVQLAKNIKLEGEK